MRNVTDKGRKLIMSQQEVSPHSLFEDSQQNMLWLNQYIF